MEDAACLAGFEVYGSKTTLKQIRENLHSLKLNAIDAEQNNVAKMVIQSTIAFGEVTFCVLTEPDKLFEVGWEEFVEKCIRADANGQKKSNVLSKLVQS
jgi:hypothetical protein